MSKVLKTNLKLIDEDAKNYPLPIGRFEYSIFKKEYKNYLPYEVLIWDRDNSSGVGKAFRSVKQAIIFINSHKEENK